MEPNENGWAPAVEYARLADRRPMRVEVGVDPVLVVRAGDRLFAIADRCTHQGASLSKGLVTISGSIAQVTCPAHRSTFDLATGRVLRSPATRPLAAYDARVDEGRIELRRRA
jgi:nitrite reductase/ring-hydroxylating ferredoxin subunit